MAIARDLDLFQQAGKSQKSFKEENWHAPITFSEFTLAVLIMECKEVTMEVQGPVRKLLQ